MFFFETYRNRFKMESIVFLCGEDKDKEILSMANTTGIHFSTPISYPDYKLVRI